MALKKPSELFGIRKSLEDSSVLESLSNVEEISESLSDTFDRFKNNFYKVEQLSYDDKIEDLSIKINSLTEELTNKLTKNDLENAMLSHLMIFDESFKKLQAQVKGLNKEDIREFKYGLSELTQLVENLLENEIPKYKKQITNNEIRLVNKFDDFKENVEDNINNAQEKVNHKVDEFIHSIDENLGSFNQRLEETSSEVKKTSDTYNRLSKIIENKVSKENEKLEEYSQVIQSLYEAFVELQNSLQEDNNSHLQVIKEKFEDISSDVKNRIGSIDEEVKSFEKSISSDISNIKADVVINEQHIKNVDKYLKEHHQELVELKEEVFSEIEQIPVGDLQENLERLEKKIDYIKETYSKIEPEVIVKEVIREGLLNEPPNIKNSDPLTPLDKKFVTLEQLQEHYRLFINRIQQQLSTLGGGGETRFKYLDDIVGIATNASAYDGKYLQWNSTTNKAEFVTVSATSTQNLDQTLGYGNTSNLGISVGVVTATSVYANGNGYFSGILTTGTVQISSGIITANSGIVTYYGDGSKLTGVNAFNVINQNLSSSPVYVTLANSIGVSSIGISTSSSNSLIFIPSTGSLGIGTTNPTSKLTISGNLLVTGIITATDFNSASDIKLKENVQRIDNPIDKIVKIDGVRFDWKSNNKSSMGVIAQNIEKVLPELVNGEESKTVNYNGIIGLLIECVKEQQKQIDELTERLNNFPK